MKQRKLALARLVAAMFCVAAFLEMPAGAAAQAAGDGSAATQGDSHPLKRIIEAIGSAKDPSAAAAEYARGRTLDKDNIALNVAYMRRMLQLGYPQVAMYPGMELIRLKADNGTAWGVLGYSHARGGRFPQAFMSTIRAMEIVPDNPGIQQNAGNLMAWYDELEDKPSLDKSLKGILTKHAGRWRKKQKYTAAYDKSRSELGARAGRILDLKKDLTQAEKEATEAARQGNAVAVRFRDNGQQIDDLEEDIRSLRIRLEILDRDKSEADSYAGRRRDLQKLDVLDRIRQRERQIRDLKEKRAVIRREAAEKMKRLSDARRALAKARAALNTEVRKPPALAWAPPAVDGVITPAAKGLPKLTPTSKPDTQSRAWDSPEVQLQMAKMLIRNNRIDEAGGVLRAIVRLYPDSEQAKEARALLYKHKLPPP